MNEFVVNPKSPYAPQQKHDGNRKVLTFTPTNGVRLKQAAAVAAVILPGGFLALGIYFIVKSLKKRAKG